MLALHFAVAFEDDKKEKSGAREGRGARRGLPDTTDENKREREREKEDDTQHLFFFLPDENKRGR